MIMALAGVFYIDRNIAQGKIEIPFSNTEVIGEQYSSIVLILKDTGFKNIQLTPQKTNDFEKDGKTRKMILDGSTNYRQGTFFSPEIQIEIEYYKALNDEDN